MFFNKEQFKAMKELFCGDMKNGVPCYYQIILQLVNLRVAHMLHTVYLVAATLSCHCRGRNRYDSPHLGVYDYGFLAASPRGWGQGSEKEMEGVFDREEGTWAEKE